MRIISGVRRSDSLSVPRILADTDACMELIFSDIRVFRFTSLRLMTKTMLTAAIVTSVSTRETSTTMRILVWK